MFLLCKVAICFRDDLADRQNLEVECPVEKEGIKHI